MTNPFPPEFFTRQDDSDDALFYLAARKVVHIDDGAIRTLTEQFRSLLPSGGALLDLMSSWRSHLPPEMKFSRVVGLGMNREELLDNPALTEMLVHDLNKIPHIPFADSEFDAVTCTVSVQYLQQPLAVFAEVHRVLKPDGIFVVSFSNRCFPTKAVAIWTNSSDSQHIALVTRYFEESGAWRDLQTVRKAGEKGWLNSGDPLYLVHARKIAVKTS